MSTAHGGIPQAPYARGMTSCWKDSGERRSTRDGGESSSNGVGPRKSTTRANRDGLGGDDVPAQAPPGTSGGDPARRRIGRTETGDLKPRRGADRPPGDRERA